MARQHPSRLAAATLLSAFAIATTWGVTGVAHTASILPEVAPAPSSRFT